jgi:biopolymer transport protein ExbB
MMMKLPSDNPRLLFVAGRTAFAAFCLAILTILSMPAVAHADWWNGDWSFRKKITIDAGPKGANLAEDPGRMPLLVRLHDGNFTFTDAKDDGSDIRFVDSDGKTPLKFHIDTYDALLGVGLIWVDVPSVKVGQPVDIWMYWGNQNAPAGGDAKGTYDADTTLVYHFSEKDAPPHDQTANANNAQTPIKSIDNGLIGRAAHLEGTPILLPASPSLTVPQNGALTWSAWVKPAGVQSLAVLFAKHDGQNGLVVSLEQGVPTVTAINGGVPAKAAATAPLTGIWHHVAVTASDKLTLYVDGKPAATLAGPLPALAGIGSIGADNAPADPNAPAADTGFLGDLDELEMSKVARSAGFVAAAFDSQGPESHLVVFGADEENAGISGGYFGIILRSVTPDGWVVIGLLGIMAAVSIVVMVNKAGLTNRVIKANGKFLEAFNAANGDVRRLRAILVDANENVMQRSVLYRVYKAADAELQRREATARHGVLILSPQAIDTIRANVDRASTEESKKLNAFMVLLTIAISGGPFLGLLGTVVGVMITFAAIAAAGDVNVNSIAPGIAAALVATVAGLAVAIPALFGYNYLVAKVKDIVSEMHGFVDELVTRLAETYSQQPDPERLAAE